jgi:hypothetical protein
MIQGFAAVAQTAAGRYQLNCSGIPQSASLKYQTSFPDSLAVIAEVDKIIHQLHFSGYFYADIQQASWHNKVLTVDFSVGEKFNSSFLKNGNIQPYILSEIKFREKFYQNQRFNIHDINDLKEQLLIWYEDNGNPFAQVWLDSITIQDHAISSFIYSHPGKQITIDTLIMVGSAKVSESFMNAYLGIKNEDLYNEYRVGLMDKRLSELSFLKQVKKPEIIFSGDKAKINLFLDKENANQFDGLIGFLSNPTTGKLQLTGDFKLKLQNALKQAETIDFNYRGLPNQSQELNLRFDYPYIFKTQIGIETDFSFFKRDTNFLNVNARLAFVYNYSADKSLGFFVERFTGNTISTPKTLSQDKNPGDVATQFYGLQGNLERLDNGLIPLRGFKIYASFGVGSRKLRDTLAVHQESKSSQFKIFTDLNYYLNLSPKSVLYLHNVSSLLTGEGLYENEVFRIGGLRTFRGFDEQSILAKSYSIQTLEYRYFVEARSYLNFFYDQGMVDQLVGNGSQLSYPFGFGAGFTFQTKAGLVSLSYAMGKQKNIPLDLQKGKIHFGITSYF